MKRVVPIYNPQKSLTTDNERFINLIEKLMQKKVATTDVSTQANGAEPVAIAVPEVDVAGEQAAKLVDEEAEVEGVAQEAEDVLDVAGDGAAAQDDAVDDAAQAEVQLNTLHIHPLNQGDVNEQIRESSTTPNIKAQSRK